MKKLNESQLIWTIVGGGLALCLAAGGGIWWANGLVEEKETEIAAIGQQIQAAEAKIRKVPALEEGVIVLRENVASYVKILPEQALLTDFLRTLSQFTSQSGANITDYVALKPQTTNKFQKYTYKITVGANVWQFMRFISLIESYDRFVKVKSFTLTSSDGKQGTKNAVLIGGNIEHRIAMELEAFVYLGKDDNKEVVIPNYAHKREKLREQIIKDSQAIKLARYDYKESRARRDPFVDPRQTSSGPVNSQINSAEAQQSTIDRVREKVASLEQVYGRYQDPALTFLEKFRLEKAMQEQILEIQRDVMEVESKSLISKHSRYFEQWRQKVVDPYQKIRNDLTGVEEGDSWLSEGEFRQLDADMRSDLAKGELESAKARFRAAQDRLNVPVGDPRFNWFEVVTKLNLQVEILSQFVKIPLEIGGVVVQENGKSGLLVNGQSYEEGDYLTASLLLKSVGREHAEFIYKGYSVKKSW